MSHVVALVLERKTILLLASLVTAVGLALLGAAQPAGAAALPEEGKILFSASGGEGLQTMNPDGSGRSSFSPPISNAGDPEWSADGTKFVYIEYINPGFSTISRIVVSSADGTQRTTVPLPDNLKDTSIQDPTLSPDGTKVAFIGPESDPSSISESTNIYTMNLDGSNLTQLDSDVPPPTDPTTVATAFDDLDWSPDGDKIALTRLDTVVRDPQCDGCPYEFPQIPEIYTVNADGTGQLSGFADPVYGVQPDWSPDGSEIVFTDGANQDLYIINADGTGQRRITTNRGEIVLFLYPAWSPKGTRIVFEGGVRPPLGCCTFDLYTIDVDGSNQTNLTNTPNQAEAGPSWQPVFPDTTPPKVTSVDPDGTNVVARNSTVTANFSEPVQASTLNSQTVQLFSGNSKKQVKAALNKTPTSVTLIPSVRLDAKTTYKAVIGTGVQDLADDPNPLDQDQDPSNGNQPKQWTFTTAAR